MLGRFDTGISHGYMFGHPSHDGNPKILLGNMNLDDLMTQNMAASGKMSKFVQTMVSGGCFILWEWDYKCLKYPEFGFNWSLDVDHDFEMA